VLCAGLEETIEGVWQDQEKEVLLFRLGLSTDGGACYATLNAHVPWGGQGGQTFAAAYSGTDLLAVAFPNRWRIEFRGDGTAQFVARGCRCVWPLGEKMSPDSGLKPHVQKQQPHALRFFKDPTWFRREFGILKQLR